MLAFNDNGNGLDLGTVHFVKSRSQDFPALTPPRDPLQNNVVFNIVNVSDFKLDLSNIRTTVIKTKHDTILERRSQINELDVRVLLSAGSRIIITEKHTAVGGGVVKVRVNALIRGGKRRDIHIAVIALLRVGAGKTHKRRKILVPARKRSRRNIRVGAVRVDVWIIVKAAGINGDNAGQRGLAIKHKIDFLNMGKINVGIVGKQSRLRNVLLHKRSADIHDADFSNAVQRVLEFNKHAGNGS